MHHNEFALALGIEAQDRCFMTGKDRRLPSNVCPGGLFARVVRVSGHIEQLAHCLDGAGTAVADF